MLVFFADGRTPCGLEWRRIGAFQYVRRAEDYVTIPTELAEAWRLTHEYVLSQAPDGGFRNERLFYDDLPWSSEDETADSDASTAAP